MYSIVDPEQFRTKVRAHIAKACNVDPLNAPYTNIEKSIYNYAIQEATRRHIVKKWDNDAFVLLYVDRLRSVYMNLSKGLGEMIQRGDVAPDQVGFMTHQEMNRDRWHETIARKIKKDQAKYNTKVQAMTTLYTCRKCKGNKTTFFEAQIRSADEGSTIFITCIECSANWKM